MASRIATGRVAERNDPIMSSNEFINENEIKERISKVIEKENDEIVKLIYDYTDIDMPDDLYRLVTFLSGTVIEVDKNEMLSGESEFSIQMKDESQPFTIRIKKTLNSQEKQFQIAKCLGRYFMLALHDEGDIRLSDLDYVSKDWVVTDFAERFLVPEFLIAEMIGDDGSVPSIDQVSKRFNVSEHLAEKRLKDLKLQIN